MTRCITLIFYCLVAFFAISCKQKKNQLFSLLPADETGLNFSNLIAENDSINIITEEYVYNGGAVAAADFNNDGLTDIFFGGNITSNKLFLNRGDLEFQDISEKAKIMDTSKWRSGVAVVDINNDGFLDIYLCVTILKDSALRANILYVNQGIDKDGIPTFVDEAAKYGIADNGYSSNAAFFDFDNDGDLDLYVLTNRIESGVPTTYRPKVVDGSALNTDRLYRNNGDGSFTNVSKQAGIVFEGYGLGLAIADINQDGWSDIYVSNDYIANDVLYINNRDGTFTNKIDSYIKHQSQFSMGNNVADINNDGLPDIITLDMLPEGNLRRKTVIGGVGYTSYINNKQYKYTHQYIRNMVQLNNGNNSFSEVGQMMQLHQTEWSWSPLFADFDNDGFKDLLITNGFPKDITDKDFTNFRSGAGGNTATPMYLSNIIPAVKVPNKAFKNIDGLTFQDVSAEWGMTTPSFSYGAAYADFDNDGDLDYVINNINDVAFFYKNNLYDKKKDKTNHYLRLKFNGKTRNESGLGTKVYAKFKDGTTQYFEHSIYKGYISCVENYIHIGLGENKKIDSLIIQWPDNRYQLLKDVQADQEIAIDYKNSSEVFSGQLTNGKKSNFYVKDVTSLKGYPKFRHQEEDKIDFNIQRTIPHKFSQSGPGIAVGDVDGDGLEDFIIGGSSGYETTLFKQALDGQFVVSTVIGTGINKSDAEGILLFDSDSDGDLDLYISHGGFEWEPDHLNYQDRLYINSGAGKFNLDTLALPKLTINSSCVRAADFDKDGDLDLFIGGRVIPGKYPLAGRSYLLQNVNGIFKDVTSTVAPQLVSPGLVTDALWSDYNNDGSIDLILVGEFMPIQIYQNSNGSLVRNKIPSIENKIGWWNSIAGGDFDQDGDIDYIIGNLGLNNYYCATESRPLTVYANDVDKNGSVDAILTCYFKDQSGNMNEYPIHFWDELNAQSPRFRRSFMSYNEYGNATISNLLTEDEQNMGYRLRANFMETSYLKNNGDKGFELIALPKIVQVAPVNGIVIMDINADSYLDVLMVGNDYGNEVFAGRYDAFTGSVLIGDGMGNFSVTPSSKSGFLVDGDAKGLARINSVKGELLLATQNQDSLKIFKPVSVLNENEFVPKSLDTSVKYNFTDGRIQKMEIYYGSGYLSQSSRRLRIPAGVKEIEVQNSEGIKRTITFGEKQ